MRLADFRTRIQTETESEPKAGDMVLIRTVSYVVVTKDPAMAAGVVVTVLPSGDLVQVALMEDR